MMKNKLSLVILTIVFVIVFIGVIIWSRSTEITFNDQQITSYLVSSPCTINCKQSNLIITPKAMEISSTAFAQNQFIPSKYTCKGINVNPPLMISNIPQSTKSIALVVDDPDAPGGVWTHWIVWNISVDIKEIAENSLPTGAVTGINDFRKPGYSGPCPPSGVHHYRFKLYALDSTLSLSPNSKVHELESELQKHILTQAELVGLFK